VLAVLVRALLGVLVRAGEKVLGVRGRRELGSVEGIRVSCAGGRKVRGRGGPAAGQPEGRDASGTDCGSREWNRRECRPTKVISQTG
jgi:hypothetical protein